MPRNSITKEEIKKIILDEKKKIHQENITFTTDPKWIANKHLNNILDRLEEYRF